MSMNGADFHLPDEILSVIPTDPFEQLDLARKITSMAIASRVRQLEAENGSLRRDIGDKDHIINELQDRVNERDRLFQESESRLRLALEENIRLVKERDALALTVKKQSRDLTKLETFKRQLMLSLNDDSPSQSEGDFGAADVSVARISAWKDQSSFSRSSLDSDIGPSKTESGEDAGNKFSITPYITPQLSPNSTPRVSSTGGSPRRFSTADSLSKFSSGATSPTTSRFEDQGSMSSRYPSSQQISAASSPPRGNSLQGRTPQIDGKEFFRQARTRLSYEQFGTFLANIKELNANRKSRQETLAKAEEIFGPENKDLYLSFQRLLNRNVQ
ncbi:uncharacterized protein At4g15545-like isoform X1 [Dendrobium catenatum]|uniref:At4g15545-like C-terminal domain-containing protein n=1 Tax=Dendrobium catenatum TaxID=906689 RepID=A0A2I0VE72_9ASPA|nr:uncharacterized protein At4g15545-like isoform X1 [Dendrobium catenatum]PKU61707.1 Uncharacterized protein MA16_Dca023173 [Dendrobium catenatum]